MNFFKRLFQKAEDSLQSIENSKPISEELTRPMNALSLARALQGEGRHHAAVAMDLLQDRKRGKRKTSLFSLVGNYDGLISLPDFAILGVADSGQQVLGSDRNQMALSSFCQHLTRIAILDLLSPDSFEEGTSLQNAVMDAYQVASHTVYCADASSDFSMTVGLIFAEMVILAHRGTTRAYHIDHHHIERITFGNYPSHGSKEGFNDARDNTSNISKGGGDSRPEFDQIVVYSRPVPRDGYLMLCTDGLWKKVEEKVIYQVVSSVGDVHKCCHDLLSCIRNPKSEEEVGVVLMYFPPDFGLWS